MKKLSNLRKGKVSHCLFKTILVMKLTILLLVVNLLQLSATNVLSQNKFSLDKKNTSLEEIFQTIESQSEYKFVYRNADIVDKTVSVSTNNSSVDEILTAVLPSTGNTYKMMANNLVVIMPDAPEQEPVITGKVTDDNGDPIPGVNVHVKETNIGTITNIDGEYELEVSNENAVLVFSFVGYLSEEIPLDGQKTVNVSLVPDVQSLEEVVVIGYGSQTRQNFTGSSTVTQVENSPLANMPSTDAMDLLRGNVPGMNVTQQTGAGQSPALLIRGQNVIQGGQYGGENRPLIVLDGVIYMGAMRDIDPSTIEDITVLKDAATIAAYGSRAANGVVMINTKKGDLGKPKISLESSYGQSKVINQADVLSPEDWIRKVNTLQGYEPDADPTIWMSDFEIENYENGQTTNWQDLVERTGHTQKNSLSISGASEKMNYFLSGSHTNTEGVLIGDDYERSTLTSRITTNITDWLEIGGNVNYSFNDYSGPTVYNIYNSIRLTPYGRVYRDEENESLEKWPRTEGLSHINPLWDVQSGTIDDRDVFYTTVLSGHSVIKLPWVEGLSYRMNYSHTLGRFERDRFTHEGWYVAEGTSDDRYEEATLTNYLTQANGYNYRIKNTSWVLDNIITYKRTLGNHNINLTGVYTRDYTDHYARRMYGDDFAEIGNTILGYDGLHYATNQFIQQQNAGGDTDNNFIRTNIGYLGRLNYSFAEKYHLSVSVRRDGASVFGNDNKWGTFPSFGLAWTPSEETFLSSIAWMDYLKLKFSYGVNGTQTLAPYSTLSVISLGQEGGFSYPFGNTSEVTWGQRLSSLGNTSLKWVETTALNSGFELDMLNNRISLDMDAYYSKTVDQIFSQNIPIMGSGIGNILATLGRIDNWGIESSLNSVNVRTSDFQWNSKLIFFMNRNEIVELYGDGQDDPANSLFIGESLGAIYGYQEDGIIQEEGDSLYVAINQGGNRVEGDVKFEDQDGNDTINTEDRTILGFDRELFRLSLSNTLTYKNFELYALFSGIFGGEDYYKSMNLYAYRTASDVVWDNNFDHPWWTPENQSNTYPRADYTDARFTPVQSRSFVRLQNLSLAYNFRQPWIKERGIDNLRLYVAATNLFTITNWEGGDPETGQTIPHPDYTNNAYNYGYPLSSTYSMGIKVSF